MVSDIVRREIAPRYKGLARLDNRRARGIVKLLSKLKKAGGYESKIFWRF